MEGFLSRLLRVEEAETETFELFTGLCHEGADLGMIAPSESTIDLSIDKYDFTITQSPGLLRSDHAQGTTGAAAWQSGVYFARWLAQPSNLLIECGIMDNTGAVLELGSGVAGIVSSIAAARLVPNGRIIASDMDYALKVLRQNLMSNFTSMTTSHKHKTQARAPAMAEVEVVKLDWERDDAKSLLKELNLPDGVDLVVACDCIYNYALLEPFVDSCAAICAMRGATEGKNPTCCIIVQHLRQPDVFEEWLALTLRDFNVWRMPADIVGPDLSTENGLVVHLLMIR